jgi:hypothetical protein
MSDIYKRIPKDNTIRTFVEDDAFKYSHEDLGPESEDDEDEAKDIITKINVKVVRYDIKTEPMDVAKPESKNAVALCVL